MFFFTFNNINLWFVERKLVSNTYSTAKILSIIKKIKIIDKKEFATMALNKDNKTFMVYIKTLNVGLNIHFF